MGVNKNNVIKWVSVLASVGSLGGTGGVFLYDYLSGEKAKDLKTNIEDDLPINNDTPSIENETKFITYSELFKNFDLKSLLTAFKVRIENEIEVNKETFKYLYMKEFFKNYKYKASDISVYFTFQTSSKINIKMDFTINNVNYISNFWISYII